MKLIKACAALKVEGRYYTNVEVIVEDNATDKEIMENVRNVAFNNYINADFGPLECIDAEMVNWTDEDDNIYDYYY